MTQMLVKLINFLMPRTHAYGYTMMYRLQYDAESALINAAARMQLLLRLVRPVTFSS